VGLERGRWRDTDPDFAMPYVHDELRFVGRHELMQDLSRETITFRNNAAETALPMRQLGSFRPGEGVGGAAVHWGGLTWRFLPWDFETKSRTLARYGKGQLADDCTSQDWGVTYEELEPHFDRFEYLYGISGKAGNIKGTVISGGEMGAKASPQTTVLPALMQTKNFELRTLCNVVRVNLDSEKKRAVSVSYVDSRGREFEQPAELVLLTSYVLNNTRLMLLSGI